MKVKKSPKNYFKSFLCFFFAVLTFISGGLIFPAPAYAEVVLPTGRDDEFGENNIVFYNPGDRKKEKKKCVSTGKCNMKGETRDEKLWSGLRGYGFSPEQTSALMGNIVHEGGTPTTQESVYVAARNKGCKTQEGNAYTIHTTVNEHHSSCMQQIYSHYSAGEEVKGIGLGFVQWTIASRREGYLAKMDALGLKDTYFEGDAYKEWGSLTDDALLSKIMSTTGSDEDYWALWCAALGFIYEELHSGSYNAFLSKSSVHDMADYVSVVYEGCNGCKPGGSSYNARMASAEDFYNKYKSGFFDSVETGNVEETDEEENGGDEGGNTSEECDSEDDGIVTKKKLSGFNYAFPIQGATKSNYLNPGGAHYSVLSKIPCPGVCHHDYPAVDLGIYYNKVTPADDPKGNFDDYHYFSTGAKVLAIVDGTISYYNKYTNKVPSSHHSVCGQTKLVGDDGYPYWYGHMSYPGNVRAGDRVTAGQVLGEVGLPQCAQNTQAHLHINISEPDHDRYIIDLINELWEDLPN